MRTEGGVLVACGRESAVELEPSDIRARIRARLIELAEERTPRFFKDGDGQFAVCPEPDRKASAGSESSGPVAPHSTVSTRVAGSERSSASSVSGSRSP
jgi:hypothetical protein